MEIVMRVNVHIDKDDVLRYESVTVLSGDNGKIIFNGESNQSISHEKYTDYEKRQLHSLLVNDVEYFRDTVSQMINGAWGGTGDEVAYPYRPGVYDGDK